MKSCPAYPDCGCGTQSGPHSCEYTPPTPPPPSPPPSPSPPRTKITEAQMRVILTAVEHGFRQGERGKNLQGALASVYEMYEVAE